MLKILGEQEWIGNITKQRKLLLNEQPDVVNAMAKSFNFTPLYLIYEKKNKTVISFIAYTKKKKISAPFHFFYSAFWVADDLSDTEYTGFLCDFIQKLQESYRKIIIRLPVGTKDIRPFIWSNFSIINNYTYLKELSSLAYHSVTEKNIRKINNKNYTCELVKPNQTSIGLNLEIFKQLDFRRSSIKCIENLLVHLNHANCLSSYNCYLDHKLITSNLILLDQDNGVAYAILLNKVSKEIKDDVHSLLHDFFFNDLKNKGFRYIDLMGGDIAGISAFKSRFNSDLYPHFTVSYDKNRSVLKKNVNVLKQAVRKILAVLN